MELALEVGAEDFKAEPEGYEIITDAAHFESIHRRFEVSGIKCEVAHITELPELTVPLGEVAAAAVARLIEELEDHDDVKEVYANAEFSE